MFVHLNSNQMATQDLDQKVRLRAYFPYSGMHNGLGHKIGSSFFTRNQRQLVFYAFELKSHGNTRPRSKGQAMSLLPLQWNTLLARA